MHNIYHKAGVEDVHERVIKTKRRIVGAEGVVFLDIGEKFNHQTQKRIHQNHNQSHH